MSEPLLDNAESQVDDNNKHSREGSFGAGHPFCGEHSPLHRLPRLIQRRVLCVEHGLLQHSQEYHASYPELNPQQVLPSTEGRNQPADPEEDVH